MPQFIEADVIQKIATPAEWATLLGTKIPYKGQIMLVSDSTGKVVNIKVGDGTNNFASLEYMFDTIQANVNYVQVTSTALPTPTITSGFSVVGEGTYTRVGQANVVVPAGSLGILGWNGTVWSLSQSVVLPTVTGVDVLNPTGQDVPKEEAVANYVKPLMDLTAPSANLSSNTFEDGGWNSFGNAQATSNIVRQISQTITADMVGQHWINGRGILPTAYAFIAVKDTSVTNPLFIRMGTGSDDDLQPITFNITSAMVGKQIRISPGSKESAPSDGGYENHFTWNMGEYPMPSFIPKGQFVLKDYYNEEEVRSLLAEKPNEVQTDGKIVRAEKIIKKTYTKINGTISPAGSGYYVYNTGAVSASTARKLITFPVTDENLKYALSGTINGASLVADAVYFGESMNYLGYGERVESGTLLLDRRPLVLPVGTRFIGTGNYNALDPIVLETYTEQDLGYDTALFGSDMEVNNGVLVRLAGVDLPSGGSGGAIDSVIASGDSTTYGADLPNPFVDRWTTLLESRLEIPITNYGFSGARAEEITVWQGGITIDCQLGSNTIPATGSRVAVTFPDINPFRATTVPNFDVYLILQNGNLVKGNLSRSTGFMQEGNTPIDTVNGLVRITSSGLSDFKRPTVLNMVSFGANNVTQFRQGEKSAEQVISEVCRMYADFSDQLPNVLLWSQNIRDAIELPVVLPIEEYLEKTFGTKFCNMRKYLASMKALKDAQVVQPGFVYTSDDETAVSNDLIPPSFKFVANSAHLNELGHKLQSNYFYTHIELYFI